MQHGRNLQAACAPVWRLMRSAPRAPLSYRSPSAGPHACIHECQLLGMTFSGSMTPTKAHLLDHVGDLVIHAVAWIRLLPM